MEIQEPSASDSIVLTPEGTAPEMDPLKSSSHTLSIVPVFDSLLYLQTQDSHQESVVHLPDTDVYDFPEPRESDFVNAPTTILPVSKYMVEKHAGTDIYRWDESGRLKDPLGQDEQIFWLASNKRYDNTPLVSREFFLALLTSIALFGKQDEKMIQEPPTPKTDRLFASQPKRDIAWSSEEEDALFSLANQFQHNWSLVSDLLSSMRLTSTHRSDRDCFQRFTALSSKGFKPEIDMDAFMQPVKSSKIKAFASSQADSDRSKMSKFLTRFEIIRKVAKKRESRRSSSMFFWKSNDKSIEKQDEPSQPECP